jgi:hypothetical protein
LPDGFFQKGEGGKWGHKREMPRLSSTLNPNGCAMHCTLGSGDSYFRQKFSLSVTKTPLTPNTRMGGREEELIYIDFMLKHLLEIRR